MILNSLLTLFGPSTPETLRFDPFPLDRILDANGAIALDHRSAFSTPRGPLEMNLPTKSCRSSATKTAKSREAVRFEGFVQRALKEDFSAVLVDQPGPPGSDNERHFLDKPGGLPRTVFHFDIIHMSIEYASQID
jgi:hypothetical protein